MQIFGFWLDDVAFAAAAGFLAGIVAADVGISFAAVFWIAVIAIGGLLLAFQWPGFWKLPLFVAVFLFIGILYFHIYANAVTTRMHLVFDQKISFSAVVADEPKISASGKFLVVSADAEPPLAGRLTILAQAGEEIHYGDLLKGQGKISPPSVADGVPLVAPTTLEVTAHGHGFWPWQKLFDLRAAMVRGVEKLAPPEAAGFLAAVAFSAKENLTEGAASAMAASGTGFLATLYGMKISILVFFVMNTFLGYLDRRFIAGFAIAVALAFVAMTGAPTAAIRAGIMVLVALWARESGGVINKRNALTFAAAGMAAWNPAVVSDIGFLASFGSVAGILYLAPALAKIFRFKDKGSWNWKENVVMNLAAQLGILPIIAAVPGGFPLISLVSGAVLIVFLPLTVAAGWLLGILGNVALPASFFIGQIGAMIADLQLVLIRFFAVLSFPVPISFNTWTGAIYYGVLIWFAARFSLSKSGEAFPFSLFPERSAPQRRTESKGPLDSSAADSLGG
jgi:predicted membrane metal-binding protein